MQIKKLQINNFGKLKNKNIELKNGINVVYGENESGKSTLLDFIISMFYGINKNKAGKEISNLDKYTPWESTGEFSGKINYELDDHESYEVYRNFEKKNPQIFDKDANDISKNYPIDKTYGNRFFYEQTKVDEELFGITNMIHQQEVKLDSKSKNSLIQKLSNIMLTGEDNVSYKQIINKLNKRQTEEIGTLKSPTKPLFITNQKIEKLEAEYKEKQNLIPTKYSVEKDIEDDKRQIDIEENNFKVMQEIEKMNNASKIEEEKINVYINSKEEIEKNKENLEEGLKNIKQNHEEKKNYKKLYLIPILFIVVSIGLFFVKPLLSIIGIVGLIVSLIFAIMKNTQENKKYRHMQEERRKAKQELQNKIEFAKNEIASKESIINELKEKIEQEKYTYQIQLQAKYPSIDIKDIQNASIYDKQNYINNLKLDLNKKELEKDRIEKELSNLAEIEEELETQRENLKELVDYNEAISIAKDALDIAYKEMKESITPKFTKDLSSTISNITGEKYKNQIYISLRISSIDDLTPENMPIFLDETFAYFDNSRLENILNFLNTKYKDKQIIILTCTKREIEILDKLKIDYNKVEM